MREGFVAREYELMVVLSPGVEGEDVPERIDALKSLLTDNGHEVSEVIDWGRRRLAYPIKSNFEGHYLIAHYSAEGAADNREVERSLRIDEQVLRHLVVRRDD